MREAGEGDGAQEGGRRISRKKKRAMEWVVDGWWIRIDVAVHTDIHGVHTYLHYVGRLDSYIIIVYVNTHSDRKSTRLNSSHWE